MTVRCVTLRRLELPLVRPYRLSYRTFETFEPFMVEVEDDEGRIAISDAHISPGSSAETRENGWRFLEHRIPRVLGQGVLEAQRIVLQDFDQSKVATTALVTALEILDGSPLLDVPEATRLPLLTPVNALKTSAIEIEIEDWLAQGFRTFKVKVGKDVEADLERVAAIQRAVGTRASIRLDANRAFGRDDAIRFARQLDPAGIELFEQPCDAEDWDANAAVAAASVVPLMLDEPICTLEDIRRAGALSNVGFCKLKLKRFGSLARLAEGLHAVRENGMEPVLGDGLGSELHNWLEACVARGTIRNAGEFNGFLKPRERLFRNPMPFEAGAIALPAGYQPELDRETIERATLETRTFQA